MNETLGWVMFAGFMASPFVIIGLVHWGHVRAARAHAQRWRGAVARLNADGTAAPVTHDAAPLGHSQAALVRYPGHRADLSFAGVRVAVECGSARGRRYEGLFHWSTVVAHLSPPLDLGLTVRRGISLPKPERVGSFGSLRWLETLGADMFDQRGVPTGDWELDRRFHFWAREPARLHSLMSPEVRRGLIGASSVLSVSMTDLAIRFEHRGNVDDRLATWMIHDAAWLANAITHAAQHVPPSAWALHYRPLFEHAAKALGFRYTLTPAMLAGQLGGLQVWCWLVMRRTDESPGVRLQVAFAEPLGLGLKLRPAQDGSFGLLRPRDVQIGDRLLDDKLDIHADDLIGVQVAFDQRARALLHHLRDRGRVYIDDQAVALESQGSLDPRDLVPLLQRARDLAALLSEGARVRRTGVVGAG